MNYDVMTQPGSVPVKLWTKGVQVEDQARQQLANLATLPFIHNHVAAMPDVHWGMGATVGSVFATRQAIIPAAVGVDIGCGMAAQRTTLKASDLPDNLGPLRSAIEDAVPHGRTDNGGPNDKGAWRSADKVEGIDDTNPDGLKALVQKHPKLNSAAARAACHIGTLGTGNHFIEVCLDEDQRVWVMLHSGSRGIGNRMGSYFIEKAKEDMKRWFINLPDADLAYIPEGSELFDDYWTALTWAQNYALVNRHYMMKACIRATETVLKRPVLGDVAAVQCHHNYASRESHFGENVIVTRKGAVRARLGDLGIIPGSMGARSYIVAGKGNPESFHSCSHGAGRAMSRTAAKKQFSLADHAKATEGIECRKDEDVLDETPGAYKDIDAVMKAQSDLVDVVHTLRQVLCVKG